MELAPAERLAVLVVDTGGGTWAVVEVTDVAFDGFSAPPGARASIHGTAGAAVHAAFDLLTLMTEGRIPAMHEHAQQSVQEFVRTLEARGYDRQAAVRVLLDMLDRRASDPPKAHREGAEAVPR